MHANTMDAKTLRCERSRWIFLRHQKEQKEQQQQNWRHEKEKHQQMKFNPTTGVKNSKRQASFLCLHGFNVILLPLCTFTLTLLMVSTLFRGTGRIVFVDAIAPTIDYSHNMRILKLPQKTPVGSLIYRLKGSDGDPNTQLVFGVSGIEARSLLDIVSVARSWNEADVYLRTPLEAPEYNLTIYVTDGNKTTQVESTILVTNENDNDTTTSSTLPPGLGSSLPFINPRHVFHVPESARPDEAIGQVTVLESEKSDLPVRFELRGKGSDRFAIKYVFGPARGQSRAEIVLAQQVDYEKQNLFNLKVLALNAWSNIRLDTRNVATMDIVITVGDVQDTPPVFKNLPLSLRVANNMQGGDLLYRFEAEDGDHGDQRGVQFALDANSPLANYFDIDKTSGELRLTKAADELALHASWELATWSQLTVFASEIPDLTSYDHLWPPMYTRAEITLLLVDVVNEAPKFIGGWQSNSGSPQLSSLLTGGGGGVASLHGYLVEPTTGGQVGQVRWYTNASDTGLPLVDNLAKSLGGRPSVLDLGLGPNGTFELSLEGRDAHMFQVDPSFPVTKQSTFALLVAPDANRSLFDYDLPTNGRTFSLELVARDFGQPERQTGRIKCLIELVDVDDHAPQFESDLYTFSVYENAQAGQLVGGVRARDADSGGGPPSTEGARVRYTRLTGHDSHLFALNPESGQITLDGHLDRERRSHYLFLVEARDSSGSGKANYSQIMINVLDVNDNAPTFLQAHYDAVLLADGTFHQPLEVKAVDPDEPNSANSQVAYEIIAGNQNDMFSIDSLSGAIYPNIAAPPSEGGNKAPNVLPQIPPILNEPIVPFPGPANQPAPEIAGKILPSHEVEETTYPSSGHHQQQRHNESLGGGWSRSAEGSGEGFSGARGEVNRTGGQQPAAIGKEQHKSGRLSVPPLDLEQLPALDLLLSLDSDQQIYQTQLGSATPRPTAGAEPTSGQLVVGRSAPPGGATYQTQTPFASSAAAKVPPVTTLIVRAHDFGIPLRSSTVKVNIYNQALLSRSVSVILNGTAEQLELRREAIERAFSSMTGSKATIESIDALSESSSISVARVRLAVPQHSLVDLTDLSALMSAIDYHPHDGQQFRYPTGSGHFINGLPDARYPGQQGGGGPMSSNITSPGLYSDIHSFALDPNSALERRLLIYIIIVGVCILALLLIWMVYSCSRGDHVKVIEKQVNSAADGRGQAASKHNRSTETGNAMNNLKTYAKMTETSSAIGNNLAKSTGQLSRRDSDTFLGGATASTLGSVNLQLPLGITTIKPDHYFMHNGQVWFEPSSAKGRITSATGGMLNERRASSAPSAASLDSALRNVIAGGHRGRPRNAAGQFFPNTIGYMENLASFEPHSAAATLFAHDDAYLLARHRLLGPPAGQQAASKGAGHRLSSRHTTATHRRHPRLGARRVAPMDLKDSREATQQALVAPSKPPRSNARRHDTEDTTTGGGETNEPSAGDYGPLGGSSDASQRYIQRRRPIRRDSLEDKDAEDEEEESDTEMGRAAAVAAAAAAIRRQASEDRSLSSPSSLVAESVVLDSDQELLGFDSTGTPIIATHARAPAPSKSLIIDMLDEQTHTGSGGASGVRYAQQGQRSRQQQQQSFAATSTTTTATGSPRKETADKRQQTSTSTNEKYLEASTKGAPAPDRSPEAAGPQEGVLEGASKEEVRAGGTAEGERADAAGGPEALPPTAKPSTSGVQMGSMSEAEGAKKEVKTAEAGERRREISQGEEDKGEPMERRGGGRGHLDARQQQQQQRGAKLGPHGRELKRAITHSGDLISELSERLTKRQMSGPDGGPTTGQVAQPLSPVAEADSSLAGGRDESGGEKRPPGSVVGGPSKSMDETASGTFGAGSSPTEDLRDMKNSELLEKQSIFAITYSGLTTDKLPE